MELLLIFIASYWIILDRSRGESMLGQHGLFKHKLFIASRRTQTCIKEVGAHFGQLHTVILP